MSDLFNISDVIFNTGTEVMATLVTSAGSFETKCHIKLEGAVSTIGVVQIENDELLAWIPPSVYEAAQPKRDDAFEVREEILYIIKAGKPVHGKSKLELSRDAVG